MEVCGVNIVTTEYNEVETNLVESVLPELNELGWLDGLESITFMRAKEWDANPYWDAYYNSTERVVYCNTDQMMYDATYVLTHECAHHAHIFPQVGVVETKQEGLDKLTDWNIRYKWFAKATEWKTYLKDIKGGYAASNHYEAVACVAGEHIAYGKRFSDVIYDVYEKLEGPALPE